VSGARSTVARPRRRWIDRIPVARILGVLLLIATGIVLGVQYLEPNKRVIPVLIAMVMFGMAWRLDTNIGIALLILLLPYPKGTIFGNTNLALTLLLLVVWLLRVTMRQSPGPIRTPVDVPVVGFLIAFIVSFYNVTPAGFQTAIENTQLMITGVLMFYLVVSNVRTEEQLMRLHLAQVVSLVTVCALAVYELYHPAAKLIPGWIEFIQYGEDFLRKNVRVGGPFFDYELLAEFCAVNLLLVVFLAIRARSTTRRLVFAGIGLLVAFVLFATVTRGAIISLTLASLYLTWIMRRHVRFVPLVVTLSLSVAAFLGFNFLVATYTRSGDLLERLLGTKFEGLVPDTRVGAWQQGWDRFLEHPIIGSGPAYVHQVGIEYVVWPHNGYLYVACLVGVVGLGFFLWLIGTLWFSTRPRVDSLTHPRYAQAFMLVAHAQMVLFIVDQMKIDFLRNRVYQAQVWLMFASIAAAHAIVSRQRAEGESALAPGAPDRSP
jgi:O-antigen ligase